MYRSSLAETIPPEIPQEARNAAMDTLGGAVNVSSEISGEIGNALLAASREAFLHGLQISMIVGVGLAAGASLLVLVMLRGVQKNNST
jgi:MFS transporter, DHA2 family, multidrug resistance protein